MNNNKYITDYVLSNAELFPDKAAIIHENTTLTWRELADGMTATAAVLAARLPKDKQVVVAMLLTNSWQFIVAYLAVLHAGHFVMPLDPSFKELEISSVLDQIPPEIVITDDSFVDRFPNGSKHVMVTDILRKKGRSRSDYLRLEPGQQIASILFTSGTTGKPKATPYTHANYLWNVEAVSDLWKWTTEDTLLCSLPLSHWHGLAMAVTGAIRHGNTLYLQTRFDASETAVMLASGKISLFMHVPIAYFKLVELEDARNYDISSVRLCVSGSSYLPPAIWQKFKASYSQDILERYGASEMGLLASNRLDERKPGSVGYLLPGVEVRVEPDGELAMKSPGLFPGYYNNQEATDSHKTPGGWWLSGDIGEFDPAGRLYLKGRIQEKMKKFGYTIYPRDVEWALLKNKEVQDVVVMSLQNEGELNDEFIYFVVTKLDDTAIQDYCSEHLPASWRPDRIVKLDEIPKTRSGKPVLRALREMVT